VITAATIMEERSIWVGVEEPPGEDCCSDDEQAEGLVAAEGPALEVAALGFGQLLVVGLDAAFDHGRARSSPEISIGEGLISKVSCGCGWKFLLAGRSTQMPNSAETPSPLFL